MNQSIEISLDHDDKSQVTIYEGGTDNIIDTCSCEELLDRLVDDNHRIKIESEIIKKRSNPLTEYVNTAAISVPLRAVIAKGDSLCDELGINPWCINEGADPYQSVGLTIHQFNKYFGEK